MRVEINGRCCYRNGAPDRFVKRVDGLDAIPRVGDLIDTSEDGKGEDLWEVQRLVFHVPDFGAPRVTIDLKVRVEDAPS